MQAQPTIVASSESLYCKLANHQHSKPGAQLTLSQEETSLLTGLLDEAEWMRTSLGAATRPTHGHYTYNLNIGWDLANTEKYVVSHVDEAGVKTELCHMNDVTEVRKLIEHLNQMAIMQALLGRVSEDITGAIDDMARRVRWEADLRGKPLPEDEGVDLNIGNGHLSALYRAAKNLKIAQTPGGLRRVTIKAAESVVVWLANHQNSMPMAALARTLNELAERQKV